MAPAVIQGGTCNAFPGAAPLGASYSDSVATVPACGPVPFPSGPQSSVSPYPGAPRTTEGYQCVEFSERFLHYRFNVAAPDVYTDGDQVVDNYTAAHPGVFTVEDATSNTPLVQGDVISFSTVSDFNSGPTHGGHTAVVQSSTVNAIGTGEITVVEENANKSGKATFHVSGFAIQGTLYKYIKWLHYKGNASTPTSGARPVDIVFAIDTTGSMAPYISSVVTSATAIVQALSSAGANFRIGIVDYKDSDFGCPDYDATTDLNFSTDASTIQASLSSLVGKVYPGSGCDPPEDVYSGVNLALGFPWRTGTTKAVIVMGDAPGHDPEPHSGLTLATVTANAKAVDPAQVYSVLVGDDPDAHAFDQALADATGGQTFDATGDPSLAGPEFVQAVTTIATTYVPSQTALTSSANPASVGASVTYSAQVSPIPSGGTMSFADGGDPILACQQADIDASGTATCTTSYSIPSTHEITAAFSGDEGLDTSLSQDVTQTIEPVAVPPAVPPAASPAATVASTVPPAVASVSSRSLAFTGPGARLAWLAGIGSSLFLLGILMFGWVGWSPANFRKLRKSRS